MTTNSNSNNVLTEILESWSRRTNMTLTNYFTTYWLFKKCTIKTRKTISSKVGLSLNVLTEILESWSRITNLTLTNYFITYWTFKNCVIKINKVVSSKVGLSLDVMTNHTRTGKYCGKSCYLVNNSLEGFFGWIREVSLRNI